MWLGGSFLVQYDQCPSEDEHFQKEVHTLSFPCRDLQVCKLRETCSFKFFLLLRTSRRPDLATSRQQPARSPFSAEY